ncbi:MAG TPA: aminodeoxychorismate synthase component I [Methylophilaceae bacterium]|nr:aminodeoxychorismate synthase component I [Methylophilaceae bacterium]
MILLKHPLPYRADSDKLFAHIAHDPWAIYLDSGYPRSQYGRYDIMTAAPLVTLVTNGKVTRIADEKGERETDEDPFKLLKSCLAVQPVTDSEFPFSGGAVGYFGYDLARRLERLPDLALDAEDIPQMMIGIYDWAVVVDHQEQNAYLVSHGIHEETRENWQALCARFEQSAPEAGEFAALSALVSNMDKVGYATAFQKIKRYIHEGDCYQVNFAQRFAARAEGDAWQAYLQLRRISPAPFSAYMNLPGLQILSASPERFLQVKRGTVETRPIKGTRPRSHDPIEDAKNKAELEASLKDRAENLMIVDLLRNDIGKSCVPGAVKVERLFALESFANVHHLVSTVTGELAPGKTSLDLLRGCFPGGSVTGAPKLRAMEIIEELEPHRRGIYCGAIGYIGFDGNMDTNIAIRTGVFSGGEFRFWAGGGIVADSELQKEYGETWDKASSMLQLMQYFGAEWSRTDVGS